MSVRNLYSGSSMDENIQVRVGTLRREIAIIREISVAQSQTKSTQFARTNDHLRRRREYRLMEIRDELRLIAGWNLRSTGRLA